MHCNEMISQQGGLSHAATAGTTSRDPHDWALFFRFLAISTVATIASIGNIFTISAIIIDDLLRKKGNSFLVSMTLADLLMTTIALPVSSVAILSQMEDSGNFCRFQFAMALMSCVTAAVFTAFVGVENFLRLRTIRQVEKHRRRRQQQHQHNPAAHHHLQGSAAGSSSGAVATSLTTLGSTTHRSIAVHMLPETRKPYRCSQFQVTVLNLTIWVVSGCLVLFHVWNMPQLMYTTCGFFDEKELNRETLIQSLLTYALCFTVFIFVGGMGFLKCVCIMKSWDRPKPYLISREFALVTSNCWNWLARFLIWCPSLLVAIVSHSHPNTQLTTSTSLSTSHTVNNLFADSAASALSSASMESAMHLSSSSSHSSSGVSNLASIISTTVSPLLLFGSNGMSNPSNIGGIVGGSGSSGGNGNNNNTTSRIYPSEVISLQRLLLWPAILPPCLSSLINAISNRDFRRCYIQLFHYCCCKTSVALTRRSRDNLRGGSDVRVHIIPGYNIYTPSAGHFSEVTATPPRFNTFKCGSLMACRRDVYEL